MAEGRDLRAKYARYDVDADTVYTPRVPKGLRKRLLEDAQGKPDSMVTKRQDELAALGPQREHGYSGDIRTAFKRSARRRALVAELEEIAQYKQAARMGVELHQAAYASAQQPNDGLETKEERELDNRLRRWEFYGPDVIDEVQDGEARYTGRPRQSYAADWATEDVHRIPSGSLSVQQLTYHALLGDKIGATVFRNVSVGEFLTSTLADRVAYAQEVSEGNTEIAIRVLAVGLERDVDIIEGTSIEFMPELLYNEASRLLGVEGVYGYSSFIDLDNPVAAVQRLYSEGSFVCEDPNDYIWGLVVEVADPLLVDSPETPPAPMEQDLEEDDSDEVITRGGRHAPLMVQLPTQ